MSSKAPFFVHRRENKPAVNTTGYNSSQQWLNYGTNNLYPQVLLERFYGSPHHAAIINTKRNYTVGDGLVYDQKDEPLHAFLTNAFVDGARETMRRTAYDLALFGGFAWAIGWSMDGTQVVSIQHLPFEKVRIASPTHEVWVRLGCTPVDGFYLSRNWASPGGEDATPFHLPGFSPLPAPEGTKAHEAPNRQANTRYVLYHATHAPGVDYYPAPDYAAALDYIRLEESLAIFHLSNVRNGMVPTGILVLPGPQPEAEAQDEIAAAIRKNLQGEWNGGELLITWQANLPDGGGSLKGVSPEFIPISTSNNADIYNALLAMCQQQIISAHQLPSPVLAGLPGAGSLGGNANEISVAAELFRNTVIVDYQQAILGELQRLLAVNGLTDKQVGFGSVSPVSAMYSDAMMEANLTRDERRAYMGYDPLTPEQRAAELAAIAAETTAKTPPNPPQGNGF